MGFVQIGDKWHLSRSHVAEMSVFLANVSEQGHGILVDWLAVDQDAPRVWLASPTRQGVEQSGLTSACVRVQEKEGGVHMESVSSSEHGSNSLQLRVRRVGARA